MRARRDFESWRELARDGSAAHACRSFEHDHLATGAREIRRADQPVVPAANHAHDRG